MTGDSSRVDLSGRIAVVTGGNGGIGRAIALGLPVRVHRWLCRLRRACVHAGLADVAYCMERARGAYNHYPVQKDTDVK